MLLLSLTIFKIFNILQGSTDDMPTDDNTPEKRVNRIFSQMDKVQNF